MCVCVCYHCTIYLLARTYKLTHMYACVHMYLHTYMHTYALRPCSKLKKQQQQHGMHLNV